MPLDDPVNEGPPLPEEARIAFRDLAKAAGINFLHINSPSEKHYVPEIMGGGAAWIDYDQDGYMDLLLVQGGRFPVPAEEKRTGPTTRLYHNNGDGTFTDVTEKSGIRHPSFGQGVAVGDYDNDGFPDLLITCYGHCHLFHNEPDGKGSRHFREVTREAGVVTDGWCTSCTFADLHGNGFLDIFMCRYVIMDLKNFPKCAHKHVNGKEVLIACGPKEFKGNQCVLYKNNGNGTFTNVSDKCCVDGKGNRTGLEPEGKGLGVLILDFDDDGIMDIFVGNDEIQNHFYRGRRNGEFESVGYSHGCAASEAGGPMGSMGVEAGDLFGKGNADIFVTTFFNEGNTLYRNEGKAFFTDVSKQGGLYHACFNNVGWGTCLLDVRRNGMLDIFVGNGHVYSNAEELDMRMPNGEKHHYKQNAQLFLGDGRGHFREISSQAGPYFLERHVGRGVAMGDYDNDGHMDIAINNCGEAAALLHNETETPNHWIRLVLEGNRPVNPQGSNRDAIGAKVTLTMAGKKLVRHLKGGGSYLSAHDRRLLVGLGAATQVDEVEVRWPNRAASTQRFGPLAADHSYRLVEGAGAAVAAHCPPIKPKRSN